MPIYEYQCRACQKISEAMQKMSDPPLTDCSCGAKGSLHRLISRNSFVLKGTGWYVTDFRDGKKGSDTPSSPGRDEAHHDPHGETSEKGEKGEKGEKAEAAAPAKPETPPEKKPEASKSGEAKATPTPSA